MTQTLHRTQVLLERQQHRELSRIADEEDRSLSDLLREIVRQELARRKADEERVWQERREAMQRIRRHRREWLADLPPDAPKLDVTEIIRQNREERDDQIWEAVFGRRDHG